MSKVWQSPQFKALRREWYKKLADTGFEDAEVSGKSEEFLKEPAMMAFHVKNKNVEKTQTVIDARYRYFQLLCEFVASEKRFDDEFDRLIMERTADGKTIREISEELKSLLPRDRQRTKFNRDTIRYVRRRYEQRWGIREWSPEQMVSRKPKPIYRVPIQLSLFPASPSRKSIRG